MLKDTDIVARAISKKKFIAGGFVQPQAFYHPDYQLGQKSCKLSFIKKNHFEDKEAFWDVCDKYVFRHKKTIASADLTAKDIKNLQMPTFFDLDNSFNGHCLLSIDLELGFLARQLAINSILDIR